MAVTGTVRAAGGLVVRRVGVAPPDVLLVHRPRYDDWTFPKGKADPGESDESCALREVEEETGLRCALGPELGRTEYVDAIGRPKVVRYWTMRALGPGEAAGAEVDELRRLPLRDAAGLLSYPRELALLDRISSGPVFLVRHAAAGHRTAWRGDDRVRPLDARGRVQAAGLVELLAGRPVERVLTSPYRRCVETVEPLADALGLPVEPREELAEGASPEEALSVALRGAVLCTHADVAAHLVGARRCKKGSVWALELVDGAPEPREYVLPAA